MDELTGLVPRPPLAYKDDDFLKRSEGRPVRILAEYLSPMSDFRHHKIRDTIAFFGSARIMEMGGMGRYYREARELARLVTNWSETLPGPRRFVVCTGGGPGIMEAANRGAQDAGGKTIGLNIGLPFEQQPNPFITPELSMEFHYFFMRKFWFAYPAKALIAFPGGFGTFDELFEILTLVQTQKLLKPMVLILYGSEFWKEVVNFDALVKHGMISASDLNLFQFADAPQSAFEILRDGLTEMYLKKGDRKDGTTPPTPEVAKTVR
jgi:uncharacterized protein (TIGR00730 family)